MKAMIAIAFQQGSEGLYPLAADQVTIGSSDSATIQLDAPDLLPEHILIAPQKEQVWVSVAPHPSRPATVNGVPFASGLLPWDSVVQLGSLQIRPFVNFAGNRIRGDADNKGKGPSPILATATVLAIGFVAMQTLFPESIAAEPALALQPPKLFAPAMCDAPSPLYAADIAAAAAQAKRERYVFDPQDGVQAANLYRRAEACFAAASRPEDAAEMKGLAETMETRIREDLHVRRLRLDRAITEEDFAEAVAQVRALSALVRHAPDSDLAHALRALDHRLHLEQQETP